MLNIPRIIFWAYPKRNALRISQGKRRDLSAYGGLGKKTILGWTLFDVSFLFYGLIGFLDFAEFVICKFCKLFGKTL
jgi:hypothetical protein